MTAADITAFLKKQPVGAACVVLSLVCGGLLYFRADAIVAAQTDYEAKAAEATKMSNNVKASPGLEEQVAEIQQLGSELNGRLVKVEQLAVNLQYFYKLEADHGVKLLDVRQNAPARPVRGAAKSTSIYTPVPFTVAAQGNYAQLVKFLGELQNGRHLCRITNASFSRSGGATASTSTEQEMTLSLSLELLGQP